jgi:hypothetical protein
MEVANTLAYYVTALLTVEKSFIVQGPGVVECCYLCLKCSCQKLSYQDKDSCFCLLGYISIASSRQMQICKKMN